MLWFKIVLLLQLTKSIVKITSSLTREIKHKYTEETNYWCQLQSGACVFNVLKNYINVYSCSVHVRSFHMLCSELIMCVCK